MPRWARFLSCSFTGLVFSLVGFLLTAYWWEGGGQFWKNLFDFVPTSGFWYLVLLFGLFAMATLLGARLVVNFTNLSVGLAGLLVGGVIACTYGLFLAAGHAGSVKFWPAGLVFALPFALAGALTTWMWERLD